MSTKQQLHQLRVSADDIASTTALGENSVVDAPDGLIVTATTAGGDATGLMSVTDDIRSRLVNKYKVGEKSPILFFFLK
jgi:hypothetical protein